MTLASISPTRQTFSPLSARRGLIGVDLGSTATKIVQLERVGGEVHLAAHWIIDEYPGGTLTRESLRGGKSLPFQAQLNGVRAAFRGRRAAATLPFALTDLRSLELPLGTDGELRSMIQEELNTEHAAESPEVCFDYVEVPSADASESELTPLAVFGVTKETALCTGNALGAAGLDCELLDSLPCAIARAVRLAEPPDSQAPIAAIDFGYSSCVFVLAREGRPLFVRPLRGWGLGALVAPLKARLHLSEQEARHLLTRSSNYEESPTVASVARSAQGLIAEPLSHFAAEAKRTIDFLDLQFRSIAPKQIMLLGCGALVPNLPEMIAAEAELPVRSWSLASASGVVSRPEDALLGVAAALSSVPWEDSTCT